MKKLLVFLVAIIIIGYVLYQNQGRIFLILLSRHQLSNPFQSSTPSTTGTYQQYKDGTYTGDAADAFYGMIQVQAIISNGKITDVQFLQYPHDALRSVAINTIAMPNLKQEAVQSQNANVDVVSGATASSNAFVQSLQSALNKAI